MTDDLNRFSFNTAIARIMELVNVLTGEKEKRESAEAPTAAAYDDAVEKLILMLAPLAPHLSDELWHQLGHPESVHLQSWPVYDPALAETGSITVVVQVNGKLRDTLQLPREASEDDVKRSALQSRKVTAALGGKTPVKFIYVKEKLLNIVVK